MIFEAIQPGLCGEASLRVASEHTAMNLGSGGVHVLATPQLVLLMERAAVAAVDHLLPEGNRTVGAQLDIRHLAPTPVGFEVTARAELFEVDGRWLNFRLQVHDGTEVVGDGTHKRYVIDMQRFGEGVTEKAG
jgi:fluoroacetyl-CoA thioesterase